MKDLAAIVKLGYIGKNLFQVRANEEKIPRED
jgi:hypothetical protein